jgi:hypothetical protein
VSLNCAVDAGVGIKLFLVEPLSDRADALFAHLGEEPPAEFYVPDPFSCRVFKHPGEPSPFRFRPLWIYVCRTHASQR